MKVFAKIVNDQNQEFRLNTVLQFGNSWDHIGNIVLINPGSSEAKTEKLTVEKNELVKFEQGFEEYEWRKFSRDSTMGFIEKIFNGSYIGKNSSLNGCIQLFNLFNLKNQNLNQALKSIETIKVNQFTFGNNSPKYFNEKPTYFGWGKVIYQDPKLKEIAESILSACPQDQRIQKNIEKQNSFYHPMYINRAQNMKHFQWYKESILTSFYQLLQDN